MKTFIALIFILLLSVSTSAQKTVDLKLQVINPTENDTLFSPGFTIPILYELQIINLGSENISTSDTLYIYMTINGDTIFQYPDMQDSTDYLTCFIEDLAIGDTITVNPVVFMPPFQDGYFDQCFTVHPKNILNPITEDNPIDNSNCMTRYFTSDYLEVDNQQGMDFKFWPNPSSNQLNFNFKMDSFQIVSLEGEEVLGYELMNNYIDVSNVASGVYILRFDHNHKVYTRKIVIE